MPEENITPTTTPQSAKASQQPSQAEPPVVPAESLPSPDSPDKSEASRPATFTFSQKMQLVKKKYEYINKQEMDPVAAEAAARKDLGFPEMTAAEKGEAAKPNIFQRILKALGITALLSRKKGGSEKKVEESFEDSEKKEEAQPTQPTQPDQTSPPAETLEDKSVENSAPQSSQPEVKPIENSEPVQASSKTTSPEVAASEEPKETETPFSAENTEAKPTPVTPPPVESVESKPEDKLPQQPQV